jgi:hypothetical protein
MSASYEGKSVIRAIEWSGSRMEGFTGHSDGMVNFFNGKNGHPICNNNFHLRDIHYRLIKDKLF